MDFDLRISELLTSRLCHALSATVGAVGNGLELVREFDDSFRDEAMELVGTSAARATAQLKCYRMSYGFAGYEALGNIEEVRSLAEGIVDEDRLNLEWPVVAAGGMTALPDGLGKLILVLIELASDMLPRGGQISVTTTDSGDCVVTAVDANARVDRQIRDVLTVAPDLDVLSARNVHACYAARLAAAYGQGLTVEEEPGYVRLACAAAAA